MFVCFYPNFSYFIFLDAEIDQFLPFQLSAVGFESAPFSYTYDARDVIIYALGVGASVQDDNGLAHLFEGHPDFGPLPTFGVVPAFGGLTGLVEGKVPGLEVDLSRVRRKRKTNFR